MSSMVALAFKTALLTLGLPAATLVPHALSAPPPGYPPARPQAYPLQASYADAQLAGAIAEWRRLRQSDGYGFEPYARFVLAHPGWPGEDGMRSAAERAIRPGLTAPGDLIRFFDRFPPRGAAARLRYAEALQAGGRAADAYREARAAWTRSGLAQADADLLLARFGGALGPADHDARMDALLWAGQTAAATRQIALTSPARRPVFASRLAYRMKAPEAAALGEIARAQGAADAGWLADRARWQTGTAQLLASRQTLAARTPLSVRPGDPEAWLKMLAATARAAANDRQYALAYDVAARVDATYAPGTDIAALSYAERDEYTNLTWIGGQVALERLGRPADAIGMFDRYARGSRTPQVQTKGWYWAGRAAEAAGQRAVADGYYGRAAQFGDYFYGQLAAERLGRPLTPPTAAAAAADPAARAAYFDREIVRAAQLLGRQGQRADQTLFLRQIAAAATSDADHRLGHELARTIGRPDLGVMLGRSARMNGHSDYVASGYPITTVPSGHVQHWTMIHAITRQESQFDRAAVSHAGARGMMQLMPATAREQAGKMGLAYSPDTLVGDPQYNIMLGSAYFQRMVGYYGGSLPLAVAAYNAGAGNVNKWLRANGDPRTGGTDWLAWIEAIPFTETRGYVQRVLENAVVYDQLNPNGRMARSDAPLSRLIGKSRPG